MCRGVGDPYFGRYFCVLSGVCCALRFTHLHAPRRDTALRSLPIPCASAPGARQIGFKF